MHMNLAHKFISIVSKKGEKTELIDIDKVLPAFPKTAIVFCKDRNYIYQGCNNMLPVIFGLQSPSQLIGIRASQLPHINRITTDKFHSANQKVLESLLPVESRVPVYFENDAPSFELNCKGFPVVDHLEKVVGIFGVSIYKILFSDNIHAFFEMIAKNKINQVVKYKNYVVTLKGHKINLTRREVIYLLYLMKGMFAKEIAIEMNICTRTTEDYMQNLKIKMGCYSKSDLISLAFESDLLKILQRSVSEQFKFNMI